MIPHVSFDHYATFHVSLNATVNQKQLFEILKEMDKDGVTSYFRIFLWPGIGNAWVEVISMYQEIYVFIIIFCWI